MRYGIRTELTGVSQEQYDALHAQFTAIMDDTDRIVLHVSGPTAGGWSVFEVWESKADYERFMQKALPLLPPGAPRPSMQEFEVYTCQTADQLRA
jgi:hypothetical protein